MGLPHMTNRLFTIPILAFVILILLGAPDTQRLFHSSTFLQLNHPAWAQSSEIFPNSTAGCYTRQQVPNTWNACDEPGQWSQIYLVNHI